MMNDLLAMGVYSDIPTIRSERKQCVGATQ